MKKKIKDFTVQEVLDYCKSKPISFCSHCPFQELCFYKFFEIPLNLNDEVNIDD